MDAVLNILQMLLHDIRRTVDEGSVTLVRVDSHIALTERLLRGMTVLLSCDHFAPLVEAALRSTQQVMNTLISVATSLADTRNGYTDLIGYYPDATTGSVKDREEDPDLTSMKMFCCISLIMVFQLQQLPCYYMCLLVRLEGGWQNLVWLSGIVIVLFQMMNWTG